MWKKLEKKERIILTIIQEYLDENRVFKFKKIIPYIVARLRIKNFNINKKGIKKVIKSLIGKNYIVEGSKLSRKDILKNKTRTKIFEYIIKNPGCYFNDIITNLHIPNNVGIWHLNILLKFNFISSREFLNHDLYHCATLDFEKVKFIHVISKKRSKKIINYLENDNDGKNKTELSEGLSMHPNTITKYLNLLEEFGLVQKVRSSRSIIYSLTEKVNEIKIEI